jgi:competence protein ComEC
MKGYRWQAKMAMKGQDDVIFMEVTPPKHGTLSWFSRMRFKVIHHLERHWKALPKRERGLLRSLVTGYRAEFSSSDRHHFLRLGLPALLAISGLHLALVYGCAWWLCRAVGVGHFSILRYVPLGLALAYGCLGGWSIPLFRAAMMLMMTHACTLIGRRPSGMQMLSLCALLELMVHPEHMESLSFALSYLGVMGIYSVFRMWPSRPEGRLQRILKGMSISWGAMAWTWPMVLMTFETIPTWAWLLSPLFFATFAGVMFWVFGLVLLSMFGECPAWLMWPFELYLDGIALLSHHQAWVIRTEAGQVYWMMVYYVSLGLWCLSFPKKKVQLWSAEPFKN